MTWGQSIRLLYRFGFGVVTFAFWITWVFEHFHRAPTLVEMIAAAVLVSLNAMNCGHLEGS